jgi:large subunit ribosomal protein L24
MAGHLAPRVTRVPDIRRGDTVLVLGGKDAGKRGTVERVERPDKAGRPVRVVLEGLNIAKRHTKARQRMNQNDRVPRIQQGGIIDIAQPLAISKVMLVCPRCDQPTRARHLSLESGIRVRACSRCGQPVEVKGA